MPWDSEAFTQRLAEAAGRFDVVSIEDRVRELTEHVQTQAETYPVDQAVRVLDLLRRGRFFSQLEKVADRFIQSGLESPRIAIQYAQSLLDQDRLTAAERVLLTLRDRDLEPDVDNEIAGLLGRAYKQMYLALRDSRSPRRDELLTKAFQCYFDVYQADVKTNLWHGINAVALCAKRKSEAHAAPGTEAFPEPESLAKEILAAVEVRRAAGIHSAWDEATAAEALISLGRKGEAIEWVLRLIGHEEITAFHLGSFERQLRTLWGLSPTETPDEYLLRLVQGELLRREGGRVDVEQAELDRVSRGATDPHLQRILGNVGAQTCRWMHTAIERGRAVARIAMRDGRPIGTGFLVPAGALVAQWEGVILMTNAHVVSPDGDRFPRPEDIVVSLEGGVRTDGQAPTFNVRTEDVVWSSPPGRLGEPDVNHLDVTLIRLPVAEALVVAEELHDELPRLGQDERVYVIGHPQGRELSFSIQDNKLLDYEDPLIHYHTPTEPGSSGSPLFDSAWRVIGIHHAGSDRSPRLRDQSGLYPANEGIRIKAIRAALRAHAAAVSR